MHWKARIDLLELKNSQLYDKAFLSQVDGVSEVRVGGKKKKYWIELNQSKMIAYGVTQRPFQILSQTNFITSNGYWQIAFIFNLDRCSDYFKFRNLVIINNGKGIITLKDIATVAIEAKEYIKVNANGKESVLIDIQLITMSTDMDLN
jgi:multidrug efflux pump subunit AcrB